MDRYQYLLLMAACLAITLPLEFVLDARVYRRWRLALAALFPVVVVFSLWDVLGIVRDHWSYSPTYVTGIRLGVMPLEELVFFVVVPLCGLLTYEAVGRLLQRIRTVARSRRTTAVGSDVSVERAPGGNGHA